MREFHFLNVIKKGLFGVQFFECPSYRESTVFINLQNFFLNLSKTPQNSRTWGIDFSLFLIFSYGKNSGI